MSVDEQFWAALRKASDEERKKFEASQQSAWDADRAERAPIIAEASRKLRPLKSELERVSALAERECAAAITRSKSELAAANRKAKADLEAAKRARDAAIGIATRDYHAAARPILNERKVKTDAITNKRESAVLAARADLISGRFA